MTFKITPKASKTLAFHFLKTHGAHNLNRDDIGRPKSMLFGGLQRQRLSSQNQKNAVRKSNWMQGYREWSTENGCSVMYRTRNSAESAIKALNSELIEKNKTLSEDKRITLTDEQKKAIIHHVISKIAGGINKKDKEDGADFSSTFKTQLVTTSDEEIMCLIKGIIDNADWDNIPIDNDAKILTKEMKVWVDNSYKNFSKLHKTMADLKVMSPEISLYGRMMTGDTLFASVDSSVQCSHAFTTHGVSVQSDYWTAREDLKIDFDDILLMPESEELQEKLRSANQNGGGMLDTRRFTTGTYYHYHNINLDQLFANLKASDKDATNAQIADVMTQLAGAYMMACLMENPSGFQTGLTTHALASAVAITLGDGFAMDASSVFENPVPWTSNTTKESAERLKTFFDVRQREFGDYIDMPIYSGELYDDQDNYMSIKTLIEHLCNEIYNHYSKVAL